jgi:predicted amidohydrolase
MTGSPEQYVALALQPSFHGVRDRSDIMANIESVSLLIDVAIWMSETELPVRLIAIPEGTLQGFADEVFDMSHGDYLSSIAIDIPGPETEALGKKAIQYNAYLICQARGTDPNIPGYYFNWAFIIDPEGEVIHKAAKHQVYYKEPSTTPHDVYDKWVEAYGDGLDSFFPVADTEIGRIGTLVCYEGSFPETARGLAVNGAEIIYRCSYAEPWVGRGAWELQNRARALDNTCYVVAPNIGPYHVAPGMDPIDVTGGHSMVVNYKGELIGCHGPTTNSWTAGGIDIRGLREFRQRAGLGNWLKELKTEVYRHIYEQPIYPLNFYADSPEKKHADRLEHFRASGEELSRRGVWAEAEATEVAHAAE